MGLQHGRYYPDPSNQAVYKDVPLQVDSNGKLIVTGTGGGGGGGDSITQAEVTLAIEDASNIDNLETPLSSIATNTTGLNSLAKDAGAVDANTLRIALGSDDLAVSRLGATNETASTSDTATSGLNGRLQRIAQRLTSLITLLPSSLGTKNATGSLSVTPSSDGIQFNTGVVTSTTIRTTLATDGPGVANLSAIATNTAGLNTLDKNTGAVGANTLRAVQARLPLTRYRNTALSSTPQQIKASAGDIYGWNFINPNTVDVFVKFFDATSPTLGSTPVILTQLVPAAASANLFGANFQEVDVHPQEIFANGISIACVTGLADSNTTAPTTPIHVSVRFV